MWCALYILKFLRIKATLINSFSDPFSLNVPRSAAHVSEPIGPFLLDMRQILVEIINEMSILKLDNQHKVALNAI